MTLPFRPLPILERWDCHTCGVCCKGHTVLLDADDVARLEKQDWNSRPEFRGTPVMRPLSFFSTQRVVAQRDDGSCIFLTSDNKCRIHAEFGEPAKPWACRMFPYQVTPVGDHVRFTMRRTCPSAAANLGRPLAEHLTEVRDLAVKALPDGPVPPPSIVLADQRSWQDVRRVTDLLERLLLDERFPMVRRLVHASRIVHALAECRLRRLSDTQLRELLPVLEPAAEKEAAAIFRERKEPGKVAKLMFRQSASEYLRDHPNLGRRWQIRERLRLAWAAVSVNRGSGKTPKLHPDLPETTFADLERPLGALPAEIVEVIDRYFASMAASLQYCGAGRFGWTVVDGFRAMVLAHPIAMWALRWLSTGRQPTKADAIQVLVWIDRSHYYPLLTGYRHRKRLDVLATVDELERLVAWYAR